MSPFSEGLELKPEVRDPITREQLKAYADASGDYNPIHIDESYAQSAGFPSVIAHGMLTMAFLGDYLVGHFPESQYRLHEFRLKFKKVTFPGDVITCHGTVKKIEPNGTLVVSVCSKNQVGETTADGDARVVPANEIDPHCLK